MSELSSTEVPTTDVDLGPEKIEDEKETGPLFHCDLYDTEVVHKVGESFLPGLATACVDNTAGGLFNTPGSVAADLRKEMIDYLTQRSESFVAEFVILEGGPDGEVLDNPYDIISGFVDDFAIEKRNLFSRFSGWLLSERREDRIDDIVQEMEMNGFWSLDRRQTIAGALVKNVDFKNLYHCSMKFNSLEEVSSHAHNCSFRSIICHNQGCDARFCASHLEKHDSTCPFKIIPCEQKCPDHILRREMDRHCITKCPMKLVNCPFYAVGCRSPIAQCLIEKHRSEELHSHLLYVLQGIYKEASEEDLKPRVEQILEAASNSRLAESRDVRYLTSVVKGLDAKLKPLVTSAKKKDDEENNAENENSEESNTKEKGSEESTQTSNTADSSDKAEVSALINKDSADNNAKKEDIDIDKNGSEQSTETSKTANLSDKAEVSDVNTAQVDNNNKDAEDSNLKTKGNEESTKTNMKSSSDKVEVSDTNTAQVRNKNKDAENSISETKGNEESTETNIKSSSDEVTTTNKETTESTMNNTNTEDNKLQGKDDEESVETSKMKNKDTAENNVKKKDIEDNTLEDKGSEGSKVENFSDKAEVTAMKKDTAESDGS